MANDILSRLFEDIPPDSGGIHKTAGQSALTDQIQGFLDMFKGAESDAPIEEQAEDKAEQKKKDAEKAQEKSAEIPPEFLAKKEEGGMDEKKEEKKDEKKEDMEEKEASISPQSVQQALHYLLQQQQGGQKHAGARARHVKTAAAAELAQGDWGAKVQAAAFADEMAKIAYFEAAGVPFEAYLKVAQGADPAAAMAASAPKGPGGPGGPPPGGPPMGGPPPGPPQGPPPQEAGADPNQVLQMLMSLPPEVQQQILQAVAGGGPGGPQ